MTRIYVIKTTKQGPQCCEVLVYSNECCYLMWFWPCIVVKYVEIKCQLDATDDFYCRSYWLLNMFRAPLCLSSGAREYYTGGWCLCLSGLLAAAAAHKPDTPSAPCHTNNLKTKAPNTTGSDHLYNTLELLMMGIMVPETCWASNKICSKNHLLHLVGILFPHI